MEYRPLPPIIPISACKGFTSEDGVKKLDYTGAGRLRSGPVWQRTPSLQICKVAEIKDLRNDYLQSSTNKGVAGKVAQTKELNGTPTDVAIQNQ
jgi:hypothetical protein